MEVDVRRSVWQKHGSRVLRVFFCRTTTPSRKNLHELRHPRAQHRTLRPSDASNRLRREPWVLGPGPAARRVGKKPPPTRVSTVEPLGLRSLGGLTRHAFQHTNMKQKDKHHTVVEVGLLRWGWGKKSHMTCMQSVLQGSKHFGDVQSAWLNHIQSYTIHARALYCHEFYSFYSI